MKNILNKILLCSCMLAGIITTSCDDFLTITPSDKIVEEDFWADKNDLTNAIYGCYRRMAEEDVITKYIYWGEMRSDNVDRSINVSSNSEIADVINANLQPTSKIFEWTPIYNCINLCNKVLAHGPEVVERDESFTYGDWQPIMAEAVTLRALHHFYLVRTFGEIPYVTVDYNNDSQELRARQIPQLAVLDSIINDLESVKDYAMTEFGSQELNRGRITKKAVYALLADVYLWRASYKAGKCHPFLIRKVLESNTLYEDEISVPEDNTPYGTTAEEDYSKCIEYCDLVMEQVRLEMIKYIKRNYTSVIDLDKLKFLLSDYLVQNLTDEKSEIAGIFDIEAHRTVFGEGNSYESIFELEFDGTVNKNKAIVGRYFNGDDKKAGELTSANSLFSDIDDTPNKTLPSKVYTKTDYRRWENIYKTEKEGQTEFDYGKFIQKEVTQVNKNAAVSIMSDNTTSVIDQTIRGGNYLDANWIMYRMSEIFLMKAEAMSQICTEDNDLKTAFSYVSAVFKRSNPYAYLKKYNSKADNDSLKYATFNTPKNLESLIMAERQRELVCEGKRWFDLVRYAQRRGNTTEMLEILTRKYSTNRKSVQKKLADMQALFSPVWETELKNNSWLYQNGVWETKETIDRKETR